MSVPLGLPAEKWVRLRYVDEVIIDPGLAGIAAHYYRANSLFDPDLTGTGHQPMNYDQLIAGYQHYTVYGSKITATVVRSGTTTLIPGYVGIFLDDNRTLTFTNAPQVLESNHRASVWRAGGGNESMPFGQPKMSLGFSAKRFFGTKTLENSLYRAAFNANPTEDANFAVWVSNIQGNDPGATILMVEIEFLAKLTERAFVAQS